MTCVGRLKVGVVKCLALAGCAEAPVPSVPAVEVPPTEQGCDPTADEPDHRLSYTSHTLATPGDLDGDGLDDLLVAAELYSSVQNQAGAVYVVYGSDGPMDVVIGDVGVRLDGPNKNWNLGTSVDGLGDVDGDGLADFGAGDESQLWVVTQAPSTDQWVTVAASAELYSSDWVVSNIARAGDVNSDGHTDILVGQHNYNHGEPSLGMAGVVPGPVEGTVDVFIEAWQLMGEVKAAPYHGDSLGAALAGGEDLDGDGVPDLVVSAPGVQDDSPGGSVYLISGVDVTF